MVRYISTHIPSCGATNGTPNKNANAVFANNIECAVPPS